MQNYTHVKFLLLCLTCLLGGLEPTGEGVPQPVHAAGVGLAQLRQGDGGDAVPATGTARNC